jgi:hypothetical protein
VTLPVALRKALAIVRDQRRAAYLQAAGSRYRLIPSDQKPCGYTINLSVRYNKEWQPWGEVGAFGVDDILCDKWSVT